MDLSFVRTYAVGGLNVISSDERSDVLQAVFSGISRRKLLDPGKNAPQWELRDRLGVNNDMNCVTPNYI